MSMKEKKKHNKATSIETFIIKYLSREDRDNIFKNTIGQELTTT